MADQRTDALRRTFAVLLAVFVVSVRSGAYGQAQSTAQQKCINTLNSDSRKVAAAQGKTNSSCVKAAAIGPIASLCLTADAAGKVGGFKLKSTGDEMKHACLAANAPSFGYTSAAVGNGAAQSREIELFVSVYRTTDPTNVISADKSQSGCQSAVTADLEKLVATKWKQYVACKKDALKLGASSAAALQLCLSGDPNSIAADPKGKITKARAKLNADIGKHCAMAPIASLFPGECSSATAATLADCLDQRAECHVCMAVGDIDGLNEDCDLFDDGSANGSCCPPGGHKIGGSCWYLAGGGESCDAACSGRGLTCDAATASFAGSLGNISNCSGVLSSLLGTPVSNTASLACTPAAGCYYDVSGSAGGWCMTPATSCAAAAPLASDRRACACH